MDQTRLGQSKTRFDALAHSQCSRSASVYYSADNAARGASYSPSEVRNVH